MLALMAPLWQLILKKRSLSGLSSAYAIHQRKGFDTFHSASEAHPLFGGRLEINPLFRERQQTRHSAPDLSGIWGQFRLLGYHSQICVTNAQSGCQRLFKTQIEQQS